MDISMMMGGYKFNYRVACVIKNNGKVLLHKNKDDDFFALPGGRVAVGEDSVATLKREFKEEIGTDIEVKEFEGLIENFFEYSDKKYHELMLLFEAEFCDKNYYDKEKIVGIEDNGKLEFVWKSIKEIKDLDVRPKFLKEKIVLNEKAGHIINNML